MHTSESRICGWVDALVRGFNLHDLGTYLTRKLTWKLQAQSDLHTDLTTDPCTYAHAHIQQDHRSSASGTSWIVNCCVSLLSTFMSEANLNCSSPCGTLIEPLCLCPPPGSLKQALQKRVAELRREKTRATQKAKHLARPCQQGFALI